MLIVRIGWYEWYPASATSISSTDLAISPGDTVEMTVTASGSTGGTATLINVSTGQKYTHTWTAQPAICGFDAEWIVEDFTSGGSRIPFADFSTITFTGASATAANGTKFGPTAAGAIIRDISQNGTVYTDCSVGDSTVVCTYV